MKKVPTPSTRGIRKNLDFKILLKIFIYYFRKFFPKLIFPRKKNFLGNYLVVTDEKNQIKGEKFQLTLDNFPDSLETIIEKINVNLLKQKYFEQSEIVVGNYKFDFNSRSIRVGELKLKLSLTHF